MAYTFLSSGEVSVADVVQLIRLTISGRLRWVHSQEFFFFSAYMGTSRKFPGRKPSKEEIGQNISGARFGYHRRCRTHGFHYLSIFDEQKQTHAVEGAVSGKMLAAVNMLFEVVTSSAYETLDGESFDAHKVDALLG